MLSNTSETRTHCCTLLNVLTRCWKAFTHTLPKCSQTRTAEIRSYTSVKRSHALLKCSLPPLKHWNAIIIEIDTLLKCSHTLLKWKTHLYYWHGLTHYWIDPTHNAELLSHTTEMRTHTYYCSAITNYWNFITCNWNALTVTPETLSMHDWNALTLYENVFCSHWNILTQHC